MINRFFRFVLIFVSMYSIVNADSSQSSNSKEPWVRVYSHGVVGVALPIDIVEGNTTIPANDVLVALTAQPNKKISYDYTWDGSSLKLVSFGTNKTVLEGCAFFTDKRAKELIDSPECKALYTKVYKKYKSRSETCSKYQHYPRLFVTHDMQTTQCIDIDSRRFIQFPVSSSDKPYTALSIGMIDETQPTSYLKLDTNKLFNCETYGSPVRYWASSMDYFQLQEEVSWQKQYLIKTDGFHYCWDSWRKIDEPEKLALDLRDGTVLLQGTSSVLRVRIADGTTEAPLSVVKVKNPLELRKVLDSHGAQECMGESIASGDCQLDTVKHLKYDKNGTFYEKDYYPMIIQGVDEIMQKEFNKGVK